MQQNSFFALEQVIDRQPLTVASATPLNKVISLMQEWGNSCNFSDAQTKDNDPNVYSNNSCVLIVENSQLRGIFTERDLVRLIAAGTDTATVTIDEVMTQNVVTITPADSQDIFTVVAMLRQHDIRHLPVIDESGNLVSIFSLVQDVTQRQTALRARLHAEEQLRIRIKQQQTVAELGQFALAAQDLALVLEQAVNLVASTLAVEYCQVLELTPDSQELILKAGVGWHEGLVGMVRIRADINSQAGYTLQQSQPVIVHNLSKETRFNGPPLLINHQVVSGMSVIIPDGENPYGILGVHTTQHRVFTQDDLNFILAIANIIAQANERQQAETLLKESQERYALAVKGSSNGLWDWNISTNEVFYAPRFKEMIGYSDAEMSNTFDAWSSKLHPEEHDRVLAAIQDHINQRVPYDIEYRLRTKQGEYLWFQARGQAIWDQNGQAVRMAGSITDISDRKRREEILKDIASGVTIPIGADFLSSLVEYLSKALQVDYAFVGEFTQSTADSIKTLAVYGKGQTINNFTCQLAKTPCSAVVNEGICIYAKGVRELFPQVSVLEDIEAEGYAAMPIYNNSGQSVGLIAVVDSKPFTDISLIEEVLKIFATRATAELERQQAELSLRQSEQKFRAIFDQTFQFIGLLEPNGNIIEANKTALDFVGLTIADVRGKPFWSTPWWSMSVEIQERIKQAIHQAAQGEFVRFEVEHPGTENRVVTVDFSLTPIKDETGQVIMLIPEGRNINELKQTEANLDKSNRILQAISSIQSQFLTDTEPGVLFDGMLDHLLELTQSEYGFIGEIFFAQDGNPIMKESYMKFRGRPYLKTHAITNIAWNEETKAFYAENAPRGMEFHNLQTLFGAVIVTGEPVIANSPSDDPRRGGLPDGHPPLNAFLGVPFYKNNQMIGMVGIANRQGGYDQAIVDYLRPLMDTYSRIIEAYKSDRTRHQVEEKNREQAALLDIANDAIMVRGLDNQLLFWNRGAERLYGWTEAEALERDADKLLYPKSLAKPTQITNIVRNKGEWQGELNQITKAGNKLVVESRWTLVKDDAGNPQSYLVVNTDITEQKQLQEQFLRAQRLESLGTLAGGIAHDLNNILAPILGFSRLLPLKLPDVDEQTKGFFQIMETNARRGAALVQQILTFSRGLEGDRGIVQIRHLIAEIGQIIRETFPKTIELEIDTPRNLFTVNADVNQLHQVLINLAVNARDAMPDGGKLIISAKNFTVDADYARLHLDAKEGSYLLITVTDTGVGIPVEIIDRIFEPFFTTKKIGRGTGLGLSTAIGIVKSHDGFVEVVSYQETNRGTQFQVFLPACDTELSVIEENEAIAQGNGELVLVVDDETAILEVTKATLETYNYRVLTAGNGIEAIAVYAQNQQAIDLVIMDIMMPSMDGKTAILTLKQINPEIKIIAVSGLIDRQEIIAELDDNVTTFMNKPCTNDDLLRIISEVIQS